MNERQKAMLKILLENDQGYLSSNEIAEKLECSEKTVRNDSKVLDVWLGKNTKATLIRKPNTGFRLAITDMERNALFSFLNLVQSPSNEVEESERLAQILELLLIQEKALTLQKLSELFFVNKAVIKKDLEKIDAFLEKYHLRITTKQRLGIEVEGNEEHRRLAISRIPSFLTMNRMDFFTQILKKEEMETVLYALEEFNQTLTNPYTDETIQSLVIHILISLKRLKLGNPIPLANPEWIQIKDRKEYKQTQVLIKKLERVFAIRFPENELIYITLHFFGGKHQNAVQETEENPYISALTAELMTRISKRLQTDFSMDEDLQIGLTIHLRSTINRIIHGLSISNPILDQIKRMYPYLFNSIGTELVSINKEMNLDIPEEETAYLTLHFQASLERMQKKSGKNKRVIVVCPMGIGASNLLRTKLERKFHSLEIVDTVSLKNIRDYSNKTIDFVISTVPLENSSLPIVEVTPLLTEAEENKLQAFIEGLDQQDTPIAEKGNLSFLRALLQEDLFIIHPSGLEHRYEIIEKLASKLADKGFVEQEYIESAIIREQHSSTCIGGRVAIPHGDPSMIKKSAIAVALLKQPLPWGKEYVSLVLLLATKDLDHLATKKLFNDIGQLSDDLALVNLLVKQKTAAEFLKLLSE